MRHELHLMNRMYMMRGLKKIKKTKSRILVSPPHEEEKTQINKERKTKCGLGSENENHVSDFLFMLIQGST